MKHSLLGVSLFVALTAALPGRAQEKSSPALLKPGQVYRKQLPADLPQAKLLMIQFSPMNLPAERPKEMARNTYNRWEHHNSVIGESNKQLREAAAQYPFAYRITTQDSIAYYQDRGYRYLLFNTSFNSYVDGTFRGSSSRGGTMTTTGVDLYIRDLVNNDKYIIDDFSETFVYYYKGQIKLLLKQVAKQFKTPKS